MGAFNPLHGAKCDTCGDESNSPQGLRCGREEGGDICQGTTRAITIVQAATGLLEQFSAGHEALVMLQLAGQDPLTAAAIACSMHNQAPSKEKPRLEVTLILYAGSRK